VRYRLVEAMVEERVPGETAGFDAGRWLS